MNDIIVAENASKSYSTGDVTTHALRDASFSIRQGTFTCIVGPSGHGKSTLMHLIGGLDKPTGGSVIIDGKNIATLSDSELAQLRARKIGFVFQFFNLIQGLTAAENIETALMLAGVPEKLQQARVRELLEEVGLPDKSESRPSQLSGGQQQRIAIARALANNPDILLMDEPTGNLDSAAESEILQLLKKLNSKGKTVVLVTHSEEVARQAERVINVRDGLIVPVAS